MMMSMRFHYRDRSIFYMIILISVLISFHELLGENCTEMTKEGNIAADSTVSFHRFFWTSLSTSIWTGPIGLGTNLAIGINNSKKIPEIYKNNDSCFIKGYMKKAKRKNIKSSVLGGILGILIAAVALNSVFNGGGQNYR